MTLPITTLDQLYPDASFFCARTTREMMCWNVANAKALPAYRLDATPAQLIGFAGKMPFVAHEAASTPEAIDFLEMCGLCCPAHLLQYRTATQAASLALDLCRKGKKMVYNFGVLPELEATGGLLTPLEQYLKLNDKAALPDFVDPHHMPQRSLHPVGELAALSSAPWQGPLFLKVAGEVSNGGGGAVRYCARQSDLAIAATEFANRLDPEETIIAENECKVERSWCVGVAVLDGKVKELGASIQLFGKPAAQAGNLLLLETPPADISQLALRIAARAGRAGYRGIAGFDIGENPGEQPVVFDLNFRPNSSTGLLLAGHAALKQTGLLVAHSFFLRHDGPLSELLEAVQAEAVAGRIIPGGIFDGPAYSKTVADPATRSCLDGWILAANTSDAAKWPALVAQRLAGK